LLQASAGRQRAGTTTSASPDPDSYCWDDANEFDFSQEGVIYLMHIPKTAGCSLKRDMAAAADTVKIFSAERCYSLRFAHNVSQVMTILRSPRAHVLSEYFQCREGAEEDRSFTLPERFDDWVLEWARSQEQGEMPEKDWVYHDDPYTCSRPTNMQAHRFTCQDPMFFAPAIDVSQAVDNMMKTEHVGILEAYQESVCLFHAKLTGALPPYCDCTNETAWSSFRSTDEKHGVQHHSLGDYSEAVMADIDSFTTVDRALYRAGVQRFLEELGEAEQKFGTRIMCNELVGEPSLQYVLAPLTS